MELDNCKCDVEMPLRFRPVSKQCSNAHDFDLNGQNLNVWAFHILYFGIRVAHLKGRGGGEFAVWEYTLVLCMCCLQQ